MDFRISVKRFVCIDYPGIVENHNAMLQTLGGTAKVTKVTLAVVSGRGLQSVLRTLGSVLIPNLTLGLETDEKY